MRAYTRGADRLRIDPGPGAPANTGAPPATANPLVAGRPHCPRTSRETSRISSGTRSNRSRKAISDSFCSTAASLSLSRSADGSISASIQAAEPIEVDDDPTVLPLVEDAQLGLAPVRPDPGDPEVGARHAARAFHQGLDPTASRSAHVGRANATTGTGCRTDKGRRRPVILRRTAPPKDHSPPYKCSKLQFNILQVRGQLCACHRRRWALIEFHIHGTGLLRTLPTGGSQKQVSRLP